MRKHWVKTWFWIQIHFLTRQIPRFSQHRFFFSERDPQGSHDICALGSECLIKTAELGRKGPQGSKMVEEGC
jgi:hypothetical protein